jgi:hypothetical protein
MTQRQLLRNCLGKARTGTLGAIRISAAAALVIAGSGLFARAAMAQGAGYLRIVTAQGAMDGASKDPAHLNWIAISSVVAADLNGDAMADRESSAPSVSEVTTSHAVVSPRDSASGLATGKTATTRGGAGVGRGISSPTGGSADRAVVSPRDASSGMASGKRMHKPFVITKELDKTSPILSQACASGQHFKEVDVDLASGGHYKLADVMVSSIQKSGGGDRPMESVSFTYQKIEMK